MGGKSKTGVGFVDNAVNYTTQGGLRDDIAAGAKNIEQNLQKQTQGLGLLLKGDWNNADRMLYDYMLVGATGGASLLMNPEDTNRITGKEYAVDRKVREGEEAAQAQAAADVAAQDAEKDRQAASNISGIVQGYNRSPGRAMTLLGGGGNRASNTLLTLMR